jgi:hypothetical protein
MPTIAQAVMGGTFGAAAGVFLCYAPSLLGGSKNPRTSHYEAMDLIDGQFLQQVTALGQGREHAKDLYDDFVDHFGTLALLKKHVTTLPNDLAWPLVARQYSLCIERLLDDFVRVLTHKRVAIVHRFAIPIQQLKAEAKSMAENINDAVEARTFRSGSPIQFNDAVL